MAKNYTEVRDLLIPKETQEENNAWALKAIAWEKFRQALIGDGRYKNRQLAAQRIILDFYLRNPEGATASVCFKAMAGGFSDAREVGCHITGIRKRAVSSGLEPDEILTRLPDKRFQPGTVLKAMGGELRLRSVVDDLAIVYRKNPPPLFVPDISAEPAFKALRED